MCDTVPYNDIRIQWVSCRHYMIRTELSVIGQGRVQHFESHLSPVLLAVVVFVFEHIKRIKVARTK